MTMVYGIGSSTFAKIPFPDSFVHNFFGKNKNSNADKTTFQKKRDEISQHERKKKSFMIFIEKIWALINFNNFIDI